MYVNMMCIHLYMTCAPLEKYTNLSVVILWQWDQLLGEREEAITFPLCSSEWPEISITLTCYFCS